MAVVSESSTDPTKRSSLLAASPVVEFELPEVERAVERLERAFGQPFAVLEAATGTLHRLGPGRLNIDIDSRLPLCEQVARRGQAEAIEECAPLLALAAPIMAGGEPTGLVAVATFLTAPVSDASDLSAAAHALGVDPEAAYKWAAQREVWNPRAVVELARSLTENMAARAKVLGLKEQLRDVSAHLLSTFEELSMLHRLTERLSLTSGESELTELAVQWLADVIPAECVAAVRLPAPVPSDGEVAGQEAAEVIAYGACPVDDGQHGKLVERLGPDAAHQCLVLNRNRTQSPTWYYPDVRELVSVPIRSNERVLGWLLAFNHTGDANGETEFGTVEASLMASVAAILGVHAGNTELYREQKQFFGSMVRAFSSAIDAKDPYTCGHSDRVARISVCLARELGASEQELNTIYLSGLLHDIGKIGIDDNVLRKPCRLTPEEYEHIKQHPELGHKILEGIKQLDQVLPVVLHHHESWDGTGYPAGLKGEECPRLARIVAVADAIDAMSSDRPYRRGMEDEKLDRVLREGAGRQWDAQVIDAAFRAREEIRQIGQTERAPLSLDVREWRG